MHQDLQRRLAAEYVTGTLRAGARRRFAQWLRVSPSLRAMVSEWEARFGPLLDGAREIEPPARVWQAIERRISGAAARTESWWTNLVFWRAFSTVSFGVAAVCAMLLAQPRYEIPPQAMVAMLMDLQEQRPAMSVAWDAGQQGEAVLRVRVIGHAEMSSDTSWELWMLPGEDDAGPVSLGKVGIEEKQTLVIPPKLAARLIHASGMAMSVEPRGGSPTGKPTGPILYSGHCIRM